MSVEIVLLRITQLKSEYLILTVTVYGLTSLILHRNLDRRNDRVGLRALDGTFMCKKIDKRPDCREQPAPRREDSVNYSRLGPPIGQNVYQFTGPDIFANEDGR